MTEFCFAPGLTRQDIAEALRCLSPRLAADAPVVGAGGAPAGKAVFASMTLMRLFGASTLEDLSERIFKANEPGSKRLADLAANLPLDAPPRLERLRFFLGPATRTITFLCRRLSRAGASPLFLAAALDVPGALGVAAGLIPLLAPPDVAGHKPDALLRAPYSFEEVRAMLTARMKDAGAIRFLWRTDAGDRIIEIGAPLEQVVGAAAADLIGRDLAEVARSLDAVEGERLALFLARRETWSGVEVAWPIADAAAAVPVSFAASPSFDHERRFLGFRGFGVIHLERVAVAPPPVAARLSPSERGGAPAAMRPDTQPLEQPEPPRLTLEAANVIPLRPFASLQKAPTPSRVDDAATAGPAAATRDLTLDEQNAFRAIASSLGAQPDEGGARAAPDFARGLGVEAPPPRPPPAETAAAAAGLLAAPSDMEAVFNSLPLGILVCRDRAPIFANRCLLDLLGCADLRAARIAGALEPIVNSLPRLARQSEIEDNIKGEVIDLYESAGHPATLRARFQAIQWGAQKATLVCLQASADSGRASLEAELRRRESEARELNAILDTAMDGVAVLDAQGRILMLNRSGEALFGFDKIEVAGEPFTMLIAPESRARAEDYLEGMKSNGVVSLLNDGREIMGLARQGGTIPIFMTLGRISGGGSSAKSDQGTRFCALLRDMTHWKKVERELDEARRQAERASALKSDFLAKVSHEIRTPLNAILGFAEVIMEERFGPVGNARYKDYLKDIHSSGALVMSLVNDLLDLSKIEAGKMELEFAPVDANQIVSECVSIMQPQASRERVVIRLALAARLPHVFADERSLRQIVLNLLSNAVKFNQPGGQVIVATAVTDAGHAVLRIRDTGVGMSAADIDVALEPFRQLATSRPSGGTGLGLPLTKALVEANRALFSIKSKKHEGTLVEVAFPPARVSAAS